MKTLFGIFVLLFSLFVPILAGTSSNTTTSTSVLHEDETEGIFQLLRSIEQNLKATVNSHQQDLNEKTVKEQEYLEVFTNEMEKAETREKQLKLQWEKAKQNLTAAQQQHADAQDIADERIQDYEQQFQNLYNHLRDELLLIHRIRFFIKKLRGGQEEHSSCKEYLLAHPNSSPSGRYHIWTEQYGDIEVYCDMETDGGGWTLIDEKLLGKHNEMMEFKFMDGPRGGCIHRKWHDASAGVFVIGDSCHATNDLNQWAATILTPHPFSEVFGNMQVWGWGTHDPDDHTQGAYTDENFFEPIGVSNYGAYVVGAHNDAQGKLLKDGDIWGLNFSGRRTYSFEKKQLGFDASKILHTSTDSAIELVRWEKYQYWIR